MQSCGLHGVMVDRRLARVPICGPWCEPEDVPSIDLDRPIHQFPRKGAEADVPSLPPGIAQVMDIGRSSALRSPGEWRIERCALPTIPCSLGACRCALDFVGGIRRSSPPPTSCLFERHQVYSPAL